MPEVAELKDPQKLEEIKEPSAEVKEVSETPEIKDGKEETEEKKELELTPEILSRIQAEADKRVNPYREKRESDTALIRSLQTQLKELKSTTGIQGLNKLAESVIAGDEAEGLEEDKIKTRKESLAKINDKIKEYNENYAVVTEAASLADEVVKSVDKKVIDHFDLADTNPAVRAKGVATLVTEAVLWINEKEAFDKIIEEIPLLQKGSEVRQQIDSFVKQYMERSNKEDKDFLIERLKQEFSVTPKKKPQVPSDGAGGKGMPDSAKDKIRAGWDEIHK